MENKETNIAQVVTTEDAMVLVEKGEAKFMSYGFDQRFFFLYEGGTYANREKEGYSLLKSIGGQNDKR